MTIARITAAGSTALGGISGAGASEIAPGDGAPAASKPGAVAPLDAKFTASASQAAEGDASRAAGPKAGADSPVAPIGMQMVLVFDDQSHAMTIKMLDIETQKVVAGASATPAAAHPEAADEPVSMASGALVNTKA